MAASQDIMQLKVRLLGISPMIWRRVLVPVSISLRELHGVLQVAMGREGVHLFAFDVYGVRYGSFELSMGSPRVALTQFGFRKNDKLSCTCDMGDGRVHEIRAEGRGTSDPKRSRPVCIGGSGACPPEECGGPHGCLERRDEAEGHDAWRDMGIMAEFLEDIVAAEAPDRQVSDFLSDDVEAAMERMAARKPFVEGKYSRGGVNERFRAGLPTICKGVFRRPSCPPPDVRGLD